MRRARVFLPLFLALLLVAGSLMAAKDKDNSAAAPGTLTVGEFALKVVKSAGDDPASMSALTAQDAVATLAKAGLHFRGSPSDPVTQADKSAYYLAVAGGLLDKINQPPGGFDQCAGLTRVPDCKACCLALPGGTSNTCGKACGQANAAQNHASPSEPTP